jgi:GNAT superfamily N-acetyltransferase
LNVESEVKVYGAVRLTTQVKVIAESSIFNKKHKRMKEQIKKAIHQDLEELVVMAKDLWPDYSPEELRVTFAEILSQDKFHILLYLIAEKSIAFIYLSIRVDYVEGSDQSPTGYVEGIYVKPAYRKKGIAQKLVEAGEQWVKQKGCKQIGSDILLHNQLSYNFHLHCGFREAARLIAFIKDLS